MPCGRYRIHALVLLLLVPALHAHGDEEELEMSVHLLQRRAALRRLSSLQVSGETKGIDLPRQDTNASRALGKSGSRRIIAERVKAHALEALQAAKRINATGVMESGYGSFFKFGGDPTIDLSLPYQFLHIGKTGGSTLKTEFAGMANLSLAEMLDHVPSGEALRTCTTRQNKYIFFVRAPVSRYISGFISRLNYGNPASPDYDPGLAWSNEEKAAYEMFPTPDAMGCALNSSNATLRNAALTGITAIFHTGHDLAWYWRGLENLKACTDQVYFVGTQENFDEDVADLVKKLDSDNALLNTNYTAEVVRGTSDVYDPLKNMSACAVTNLRQYYREDYEIIEHLVAAGKLPESYLAEIRSVDVPTLKGA